MNTRQMQNGMIGLILLSLLCITITIITLHQSAQQTPYTVAAMHIKEDNIPLIQELSRSLVYAESNVAPKSPPISRPYIFVGVFTVIGDWQRRHQVRTSWQVTAHPAVTTRFITGLPNVTDTVEMDLLTVENRTYGDIVVLNMAENMNHGKSWQYITWLYTNDEKYGTGSRGICNDEQYDFAMKADSDSIVHLDHLYTSAQQLLNGQWQSKPVYWGAWRGRPKWNKDSHMNGGGYLISTDIQRHIALNTDLKHSRGPEDMMIARHINQSGIDVQWVGDRRFDGGYQPITRCDFIRLHPVKTAAQYWLALHNMLRLSEQCEPKIAVDQLS